jgi:hypothetical protein
MRKPTGTSLSGFAACTAALVSLLSVAHVSIQANEQFIKKRIDTSKRPANLSKNEPGWVWMVNPGEFRLGAGGLISTGANGCISVDAVVESGTGVLRIFLLRAVPGAPDDRSDNARVVVFTADGERHLAQPDPVQSEARDGQRRFALRKASFTLDPDELAPNKVAYLGVEWAAPPAP